MGDFPVGWNKMKVVYKDVGFFHGYYIQKGHRFFRIPNWIGRLFA